MDLLSCVPGVVELSWTAYEMGQGYQPNGPMKSGQMGMQVKANDMTGVPIELQTWSECRHGWILTVQGFSSEELNEPRTLKTTFGPAGKTWQRCARCALSWLLMQPRPVAKW